MNATTTRQTMRNLDQAYRMAGRPITRDAETWYVRVDGAVLVKVSRPLEWAVDAEKAGVAITSN